MTEGVFMKRIISKNRLAFCLYVFFVLSSSVHAGKFVEVTGWGGGNPAQVVPAAADIGFTEIVTHHDDSSIFRNFISTGKKYGIDIMAWMYLGDIQAFKNAFPESVPPLQEMSGDEQQKLKSMQADKNLGKSGYQFGGEPVLDLEVLTTPLLCFHDKRVLAAFKKQADEMMSFDGVRGIAYDYFGYQNYHCCHCPKSMEKFLQYKKMYPGLEEKEAFKKFSIDSLVAFNNELSAYIRSRYPKAKIITHVYPVYMPDPLYGNRLDVDVCAQTCAWFFEPYWSTEKIKKYTRITFGHANKYFNHSKGAALLGFSNRPLTSIKSPEQLEKEILSILDGGGDRIQICSLNDAINNKEVSALFKRYFAKHTDLKNENNNQKVWK